MNILEKGGICRAPAGQIPDDAVRSLIAVHPAPAAADLAGANDHVSPMHDANFTGDNAPLAVAALSSGLPDKFAIQDGQHRTMTILRLLKSHGATEWPNPALAEAKDRA